MQDLPKETGGAPSPREALAMCHRCIGQMVGRLEAIAHEIVAAAPQSPPADLAERARALVSDIDEALGVHVADEEADVFPAVLAAADSPARREQAFELVSSLLVEHRELSELWHALRIPLLGLGGGVAVPFPGGTAADFLMRLQRHLDREGVELADLLGVVGADQSRRISLSIAHRHEEACPRLRGCPNKP
jgi:hypothetical protein